MIKMVILDQNKLILLILIIQKSEICELHIYYS